MDTFIKQSQQGDKEAFAKIYSQYFAQINKFIFFKTHDQNLAFDLSQQTFLNAWKSIDKYNDYGVSFSSWLYAIARNLIVDHFRKQEKSISIDDLIENLTEEAKFVDKTLDKDQIERAIATLPDIEQQVVTLRFLDELSLEDVAKVMNKSKGATSTLQYRALAKLRKVTKE